MDDKKLKEKISQIEPILLFIMKEVQYAETQMLSEVKLNISQSFALETIAANEGITMSKLADALFAKSSTMTKIVDYLVENALAERVRNLEDRRVVRIYSTDKGQEFVEKIQQQRQKHLLGIVKLLEDQDQQKFFEVFKTWEIRLKVR